MDLRARLREAICIYPECKAHEAVIDRVIKVIEEVDMDEYLVYPQGEFEKRVTKKGREVAYRFAQHMANEENHPFMVRKHGAMGVKTFEPEE